MNVKAREGVWFIYDGDCPICSMAAHALRIREQLGPIALLNAREDNAHPLLQRVRDEGLDLDEGMVILHDGRFYHGQAALQFMARHGAPKGPFNRFMLPVFRSPTLGRLVYPWMRGIRNGLLKIRGKSAIDNLGRATEPTFKPVFGAHWESLPTALQKRYGVRPYTNDKVVVDGIVNVVCRWPLRIAQPCYRLLGSIPLATEYAVRCTVHIKSSPRDRRLAQVRHLWFVQRRYYRFRSRMMPLQTGRVMEQMRFGFCWCMRICWQDDKVQLRHDGYALHWFGHRIPLPLTWLLGRCDGEETALDEEHFAMRVTMTHPLFGELYSYAGTFRITQQSMP